MSVFHRTPSRAVLVLLSLCLVLMATTTSAFLHSANSVQVRNTVVAQSSSSSQLGMGLFDGISKAFSNEEYGAPPEAIKATARHILVESEGEAKVLMKMISSGEKSFEDAAREFSTCPSANQGGSLGSFPPGRMVPEFDKAIFNPDTKIGELVGPVLTNFGHHIIVVEKRTGGGDWY